MFAGLHNQSPLLNYALMYCYLTDLRVFYVEYQQHNDLSLHVF